MIEGRIASDKPLVLAVEVLEAFLCSLELAGQLGHAVAVRAGIVAAIGQCADVLAEHFPGRVGDNPDELPSFKKVPQIAFPDELRQTSDIGYVVREFTVTPPTVRALIDLGLPFTLTTVEPASAHLQAVIGYIPRRIRSW